MFILAVSLNSCDTPTRPKPEKSKQVLPIPDHGASMLPASPNLNIQPSAARGQAEPALPHAYKLLKEYARNHPDQPYAAIAGVWNSKEKRYSYRSMPLHFPDSVKQAAADTAQLYQYRLTRDHTQAWRILAGLIPSTAGAKKLMDHWLQYPDRAKVKELRTGPAGSSASNQQGVKRVLSSADIVEYADGTVCIWFDSGSPRSVCSNPGVVVTAEKPSQENEHFDNGDYGNGGSGWPSGSGCQFCSTGGGGGGTTITTVDGFLVSYGNYFNAAQKDFIRENLWMIPYLKKYIDNGGLLSKPGWPQNMGPIGKLIMNIAFKNPESAQFFARFWKEQGDWHISQKMFNNIVSDAESFQDPNKNYNTGKGAYKKIFDLNRTGSKYEKGLGTFTVYYDSDDNPIGIFDKYDFNVEGAKYKVYTGNYFYDKPLQIYKSEYGFTSRGFINEWETRGMKGLSLLGAGKPYEIVYP